jgi:hypothetical protein
MADIRAMRKAKADSSRAAKAMAKTESAKAKAGASAKAKAKAGAKVRAGAKAKGQPRRARSKKAAEEDTRASHEETEGGVAASSTVAVEHPGGDLGSSVSNGASSGSSSESSSGSSSESSSKSDPQPPPQVRRRLRTKQPAPPAYAPAPPAVTDGDSEGTDIEKIIPARGTTNLRDWGTTRKPAAWKRRWSEGDIIRDYLDDPAAAEQYWNPDLSGEEWFQREAVQAIYRDRKRYFRNDGETKSAYLDRMKRIRY